MHGRQTRSLVSAPSRLHRVTLSEVRAVDPTKDTGEFDAIVLRYNTRDDYNTEFQPACFRESLADEMPKIAWGHDWREMVGQWMQVLQDDQTLLKLRGKLDLEMIPVYAADGETIINRVPAVPLAWQAWAQLRSGTARRFSVGFIPEGWIDVAEGEDYYRAFTKGRLDEVSIVLAGAVPGTELVATRSAGIKLNVREPVVPKEQVAALLVRLQSGDIDLADALMTLKQMPAVGDTNDEPADPPEAPPVPAEEPAEPEAPEVPGDPEAPPEGEPPAPEPTIPDEDDDELEADMAEALELVGRL